MDSANNLFSEYSQISQRKPIIRTHLLSEIGSDYMDVVHLSRFDSNKYQSILHFKKRIAGYSDGEIEKLMSQRSAKYDRGINEFGEMAVGKIRRQQKRLTPDEIQALISEYLSGKEPPELGKEFGIHRITASKILKRNGVAIRNTCNRKT